MKISKFLIFLIITIIFFLNFVNSSSTEWPEWLSEVNKTSVLCETDNDEIGRKLGCSCNQTTGNEYIKGTLMADCRNKALGGGGKLPLPPRLNVSVVVRQLDFTNNLFEKIDEDTFGFVEGVNELYLIDNRIKTIENLNFPRLIILNLKFNFIQNITGKTFKNIDKIQSLDLSFNAIEFIEHEALPKLHNLRKLNLASNPLDHPLLFNDEFPLAINNLLKLEELDLSNTSLPDFPIVALNGSFNLKTLILRDNLISYMPTSVLHHLSKLEYLDLSGNFFTQIHADSFRGMPNLLILKLDSLKFLEEIKNHAFSGLTSLNELSCQYNHKLSFIEPLAFKNDSRVNLEFGDCNPKIVRLGDNNLKYFDYPLLTWKDLEELELQRNPWICDCNLQWVGEFRQHKPQDASILMDDNFRCSEPKPLHNLDVASIPPEEMLCYASAGAIAGTIVILIFCFFVVMFVLVVVFSYYGIIPDCFVKLNIFGSGSSMPKYRRFNPKPNSKSANYHRADEQPPDSEWNNGTENIGPHY